MPVGSYVQHTVLGLGRLRGDHVNKITDYKSKSVL